MPTALRAMPTSAIEPPSIQTAADAAAIAQSPARRSTFSCALPAPGRTGSRTSVSISPPPTAVVYGPDVEILHRDRARALGVTDHDVGPDRRADRGQVLGCVGLAQRAADRAAVADDGVGDHGFRVPEDREAAREEVGLQQVDVAGQRPDRDLAVLLADVRELGQVVDVDQVLGVREPELHHRQQAVPARDDACLGTEPLERCDRAVDTRRALVLE